MTSHMKRAIYLVILCITNVWCSWPDVDNDLSEDSDDDNKLKEALVLVDLLKNDYMRALRENRELRKMGNTETTPITDGESSSASTEGPTPVSGSPTFKSVTTVLTKPMLSSTATATSKSTKVKPKKVSPFRTPDQSTPTRLYRRMGDAKPHSFQQFPGQNTRLPYKLNRRQMPVNYNHGAGAPGVFAPFRRQQARRQMSTTGSQVVQVSKRPRDMSEHSKPENIHVDDSEEDHASTNRMSTTPETTDVQAQVASELLSEIKIEEMMTKNYLALIKPTLKVHLGGSTRLPIPLPENHAFCYTNPRNPLCRTAI